MGKESITLNLRNSTELINVFIGKIGSGKTYILSHLQPFSTVGTLDIRNTDDPIIEGRDGLKRIVYLKDDPLKLPKDNIAIEINELNMIQDYKYISATSIPRTEILNGFLRPEKSLVKPLKFFSLRYPEISSLPPFLTQHNIFLSVVNIFVSIRINLLNLGKKGLTYTLYFVIMGRYYV